MLALLAIFRSVIFTAILFFDQWKVICIGLISEKHLCMQIKNRIVWKRNSCLFHIKKKI